MDVIFLISLPRSGSTLLQRFMASRDEVKTSAEPWLLLPLLSYMEDMQGESVYASDLCAVAIREFFDRKGNGAFCKAVQAYADEAYSCDAKYFLDKTPRYALVLDSLRKCFPESKYIILLRDPLDIVSSIINTWGDSGKRWRIKSYEQDLYLGMQNIVRAITEPALFTLVVRYDDFVQNPEKEGRSIDEFLGFEPSAISLNDGAVAGQMGDKSGIKQYSNISSGSVRSNSVFCNPLRRRWARRYICFLDDCGYFDVTGYDKEELLQRINEQKGLTYLGRDIFEGLFQVFKIIFPLRRWLYGVRHNKRSYEMR